MTTEYSAPPQRPAPVPSPNTVLNQDASNRSSPPQTPQTPQNRRPRTVRSQTAPRVRPSTRETFLDDVTPVEGARGDFGGDERDPHDLAFSPKHVTRASVVDNMLMALDQFSNPTPTTVASREPPNASLRYNSMIGRRRGNTSSSDVSSDNDSKTDEVLSSQTSPCGRRSYSNSNPHFPRSLQTVPSLYEEEEPQARIRVFDSQRAFAPSDQRYTGHGKNGRKSGKSSGSSSVDLGQTISGGRLGSAGSRRSRSFDFGSSRRGLPIFEHVTKPAKPYNLADEMEAAPTPIVHAGPRRSYSPIRHNTTAPLSPIYDPASLSSTKPSKNQHVRKGRAGTTGAVTTKSRDDLRDLHDNLENLPPMPTYFPPPPQGTPMASRKPSLVPADPVPASKERPGFFRRVFGSKNASATALQATDSENSVTRELLTKSPTEESFRGNASPARLHKQLTKDPNPSSTTAQKDPQTITKKSSAFFRRRKKSLSEHMPTPLPLSLKSVKTEVPEPSPVSSLRQVMHPYLTGGNLPSPNFESREYSPQGFHTAHTSFSKHNDVAPNHAERKQGSSSQSEQTISSLSMPESKHNLKIRLPQKEQQDSTFLADSSGTEEPSIRSRHNTPRGSSDGRARISPRTTPNSQVSESSLAVRFPFTSANNSRVPTPSSGSQTPHSPSSPTLSDPAVLSKTTRPSNLKINSDPSKYSRRGSSSKDHAVRNSPLPSGSDVSVYKSAPSTPLTSYYDNGDAVVQSPTIHITASPKAMNTESNSEEDREQALKIFENRDENLDPGEVSAWLGDAGDGRERVRMAYMDLFDWKSVDILSALRGLCARIALKGETQQVDRMLDAFSKRWCECNSNHGFKSSGKLFVRDDMFVTDNTRRRPHHLLLYSASEHRLASCRHWSEDDEKPVHSQYTADYTTCCF
jgi:Sec7 domain